MLQRAASNAYSWWWASHIRTKQSKWMEQNLKDIEEKVSIVIKLIDEDGDSFAKRAEMYYKKRPELIQFVEEFYKAYRALAERYDHISTELQNANNTIASVCPEQAQFAMDDDEECGSPKFAKSPVNYKGDVPKVPDLPVKDLKSLITSATKKTEPKKPTKVTTDAVPKSGLTKAEGLEEIHKLQKRILALQTEKQFVKGSYESGLAKYWEIEDEIKALQEKVYSLEDEFGEGKVIEDDEARTLMTAKAIQSCKETLTQMQEKQDRSVVEAEVEQKRIKDAREKLDSLKNKFHLTEVGWERPSDVHNSGIVAERSKKFEQEASDTTQKRKEIETSIPKMKEQFEFGPCESLTVAEMVEKVDELVNKVISLETAFSSQEALIQRLRTETDELQAQIQTLEDDKATLIHVKNDLRNKLMEMEEKFHGIQDLNQSVEDQNNNLQTHFTEAHSNIDHLSEKVHSMKPGEKLEIEKSSSGEAKSSKEEEIGDYGKMPKEVKAGKEFVVEHASERENSPAEVKSSKESEERSNLDASDGCKSLQSAKQAMVVVSDSLSREEDCVVKVSSTKELEERGEKLDHSDGCTKGGDAESEVREDLKLEKREEAEEHDSVRTSTDEGGVHHETSKPSEKCEDLIAENKVDKQPPLLIVDNTLVKVESKEQERRLEDASKGGDTEPKAREDLKREEREEAEEHDSVRTSKNEGGVHQETSKPSEKREDQVAEETVDKQAPLLTVDAVAKVGSKDQERGQEDDPKGGDTEPKTREDLKLKEEEDAKEHDSVRTSTNEGGVHHETSEPSDKHEDQVAEDEVDKQAPLLTVDAVAKVGSKDQERGQEDESKGGDTEPKARGDLKLEEEDAKEHDSVRTSTNEGGVHHETSKPSEKCEDLIAEDKVDKQAPFLTMDAVAKVGAKDQERGEEDEPDWKQLFSKGMGDRERTLLTEYTMALRKYKEVKKKLVEVEANNQNMLFDIMLQLKELKSHNAMKDEEIRSLRQKLNLLQTSIAEINSTDQYVDPRISTEKPVVTETSIAPAHKEEGNEPTVMNQPPTMSAIEAKFRMNIDALLEENLEFWFRFGTAFHEVQKFENGVKDLVGEVSKLGERQKQEGSSTKKYSLKSDVRPLYEHLKEIQHEVTLWVENSASLKEELKKRFSSLCEIQEEITKALKASAEDDDFSFTSYQAVKFQGEILNMKQENNKVADELQAGYNRVTALQIEIERSLAKLSDDWDLSGSKSHQSSEPQQSHSRSGVPLRSFIFGAKLKKQKASIFSFVQPTLHRKFSSSRSGNQ
ncbi:hypothetical protein ERO13_A11G207100v2 [Gossypium hirsutum]|uniref:Protein NETWORKED 2A n=3 Tax=Gossypium TaxID=3633 RepID=A0A1U8N1Q5_GOSHI|nr:protein NETWORKED 2A [Gossypium hirsutum]KAB2058198.1 hypothetical protein ES319_A11G218000v1 [Gossypium barbadense]KAG4175797.1 hypothetical protein ERO13_A11G207100v2 [Gossypium hirsutum]TYG95048.1 hypothetical protein ES288_A11G236400v1 [Gossypium darwinii]